MERCRQRGNAVGLGRGQVALLVGVVAKVVELDPTAILEKLDELKVTFAHRARRRRPADIAREVPEQTLAHRRLAALHETGEARAVEHLPGGPTGTAQLEQRRVEVDRGHGHRGCRSLLRHTGARDDQWHANASLVELSLAAGEWCRVLLRAAIVGREDHDRVVREPERLERGHDPAHVLINRLDRGGVGGVVPAIRTGLRLPFVLGEQIRLRVERRVDGVVGEVREERTGAVLFHEGEYLIRQPVREIVAVVVEILVLAETDRLGKHHRVESLAAGSHRA